jgi:hypothetical protein
VTAGGTSRCFPATGELLIWGGRIRRERTRKGIMAVLSLD